MKALPIKTDGRGAERTARLVHLGCFRPVYYKSVSSQEVRALRGARKAIQKSVIVLQLSLRVLLRNFGFKFGAISRDKFERRIRELSDGNPMHEAATEPILRAGASLLQELATLENAVRSLA